AASATAPPPTAAPNPTAPTKVLSSGTVGETLTTSLWSLTLDRVEWPGKVIEWATPLSGKYEAKGTLLLAVLLVRDKSPSNASLTLRSFQINSENGDSWDPVLCCEPFLTARGDRALLPATGFRAGDTQRMTVIFDVSPGVRDLALVFTEDKGHFWKLPNPPAP
ncbi:MAG: hypothetical protein AAB289_02585, partial [Chloroflexota bacterium]